MSPSDWPAYRRLADQLRADIEAGRLAPGEVLPSEAEMAARHRISRDTVREAIALLRRWGLVVPRQGVGSFVRERPAPVVVRLGIRVSARMPTAAEQERWGLDDGVPVLVVRRGEEETVYPADRTVLEL